MTPDLLNWLGACSKDPYAFVLGAFPWGEPGSRLEKEQGPNEWQTKVLKAVATGLLTVNEAIQIAVASGHGVGKSALVSWLLLWAISTAPNTRGVVTANTETQLKTKTWVELGKWFHMCIAKDLFTLTATQLFAKSAAEDWRIDMVPWSERNTEAFAGLHNKGRRIIMIFDEASAIPDIIWETAEGALTDADTEIMWFVFGNPTRNTGRFRECFPGQRFGKYWDTLQVDSRNVPQSNKAQIAKWEEGYGADSDWFKIRVKGEFPDIGEMEFFSAADIDAAMAREAVAHLTDPLAIGVDVARYGMNSSVIYPRKGRDAVTIARQKYKGMNTVQLADKIAETHFALHSDGIFIDGGGVGGGVVDNVRQKNLFCYEVQFGGKDDTPHQAFGSGGERYANKRSGMYGAMRAWVKTGSIPNDPDIRKQFMSIKYVINKRDEIQLVSKEDMLKLDPTLELDEIDALATTFAHALASHANAGREWGHPPAMVSEYNPFAEERMVA